MWTKAESHPEKGGTREMSLSSPIADQFWPANRLPVRRFQLSYKVAQTPMPPRLGRKGKTWDDGELNWVY